MSFSGPAWFAEHEGKRQRDLEQAARDASVRMNTRAERGDPVSPAQKEAYDKHMARVLEKRAQIAEMLEKQQEQERKAEKEKYNELPVDDLDEEDRIAFERMDAVIEAEEAAEADAKARKERALASLEKELEGLFDKKGGRKSRARKARATRKRKTTRRRS